MAIVVFLVDTSASMSQRTCVNGSGAQNTLLDMAKQAVEMFVEHRQRLGAGNLDRYMLLTYDEPPAHIKSGWKENMETFLHEVRNLQCNSLTTTKSGLRNVYEMLNLFRLQTGIDTYGNGRCPFYCDPTAIVIVSDGGLDQVALQLPAAKKPTLPGAHLTKDLYRWDQRLYALALRPPALQQLDETEGRLPHDDEGPLEKICAATGGRSYKVTSQKMLSKCIESLANKVRPGVIVNFGVLPPPPVFLRLQPAKLMIYVHKASADNQIPMHWPLPEAYGFVEGNAETLPSRDAYPKLGISPWPTKQPSLVQKFFPFDRYELEACELTEQLLRQLDERKCVQVSVTHENGQKAIGYLKTWLEQVYFYVLPYNYPALQPLLLDLLKSHRVRKTIAAQSIEYNFKTYLESLPLYYRPFLRNALFKMKDHQDHLLIPLPLISGLHGLTLSSGISAHLSAIKATAKELNEQQTARVDNLRKQRCAAKHEPIVLTAEPIGPFLNHPQLRDTFADMHARLSVSLQREQTFRLPQIERQTPTATISYRNPFAIPRHSLVADISRMRAALLRPSDSRQKLITNNVGHSVSMQQMSNFKARMRHNQKFALKPVVPAENKHTLFGNPYKKPQRVLMIDEADSTEHMDDVVSPGSGQGELRRRKGPLQQDFKYQRSPQTPPHAAADSDDSQASCSRSSSRMHTAAVGHSHLPICLPTNTDNVVPPTACSPSALPNVKHKAEISLIVQQWRRANAEQSNANSPAADDQRRKAIEAHNLALREQIFRCIRRPGHDYSQLLAHLDQLQGDHATQADFVRVCIRESQRFRRSHMVDSITDWWARKEAQLKSDVHDP